MTRLTAFSSTLVLSLFVCGAAFADGNASGAATAGSVNTSGGGYATDATDRGGRPAPQAPTDGVLDGSVAALLAWLRSARN